MATTNVPAPVSSDVAALNTARESAVSSGQNAYGGNLANLSTFNSSNPSTTVTPPPPVGQTQDASAINSQLSGTTSATVIPPPPPAPTQGTSANTSVTNPIANPQDIIDQGNAQTPGEKTNQGFLQKVAALIGQKQSQTGMANTAEANAGVPALTKTVNDLNTQLEGLNNQATDLQNQASQGGAIQNQEQQDVLGRGVTAGGLAPQTAGDLRKNQIQQSAIASHALTLKSAIYGAQGQLSLAKDAADKAAQAQYEDQQNQIDYQKALIDANLPQMNKEEKNQALLIQTKLADRQTQIQQAQDDKKTIIGLAVAAMSNNPGNLAAQYAAQQALAESNKAQPDLKAALGLVGSYQRDPLDVQAKIASIQASRASTAKSYFDMSQPKAPTQAQTVYANYAPRLETANSTIDALSQSVMKLPSATFLAQEKVPSILQSKTIQQYDQAKSNFINAVLRQESGAAISDTERASYDKQYFPQPGDSQAVIDQKAQNRAQVASSYKTAAGSAYVPAIGAVTSSNAVTKSGKTFDTAAAKKAGYTDAQIQAYLNTN